VTALASAQLLTVHAACEKPESRVGLHAGLLAHPNTSDTQPSLLLLSLLFEVLYCFLSVGCFLSVVLSWHNATAAVKGGTVRMKFASYFLKYSVLVPSLCDADL
jgi:hypothetical protein